MYRRDLFCPARRVVHDSEMHKRCDYFVRILYCVGPVWSINYYY